jgi:hypothetical protein
MDNASVSRDRERTILEAGIEVVPNPHRHAEALWTDDLFAWFGRHIVLIGEASQGRWIVARGWRQGDRLTDVRRWSFVEPCLFVRQFRRLSAEATEDAAVGRAVGALARDWIEARLRSSAGAGSPVEFF